MKLSWKEINPTWKEIESIGADSLSDMDMGWNPETKDFTLFAVEWETMYGRHWQYFKTEEARSQKIDEVEQDTLRLVVEYREEMKKENILKGQRIQAQKRALKEAKTLGGNFPILKQLLEEAR